MSRLMLRLPNMPRARLLYSRSNRTAPIVALSVVLATVSNAFAGNVSGKFINGDTTGDATSISQKSVSKFDNSEDNKESPEATSDKNISEVSDTSKQQEEDEALREEQEAEALAKQRAEAAAWNHFDLAH